jgi:FkbM family methyltransferase
MFSVTDTFKTLKRRWGILLLSPKFVENWHAAFLAYLLRRPINIKFRNGIHGYFGGIDIYRIVHFMGLKVNLKQVSNDIFDVSIGDYKLRAPVKNLDSFEYIFLNDRLNGSIDYQGKTVLDIGAYIGDTATYFGYKGASKIICYEPVKEFFYWLGQNVELNGINAELYNLGISDKHGEMEIPYSNLDCLVGCGGKQFTKIETLSLSEVLQKHSSIDICKFVSPGSEQAILRLSDAELFKVPTWIIETTDEKYKTALIYRFSKAGFKSKRIIHKPIFKEWYFLFIELV